MGIPGFYRWLKERFPKIPVSIAEQASLQLQSNLETLIALQQTVDPVATENSGKPQESLSVDCFYLDMNGIIHNCSHPDDEDPPADIEEAMRRVYKYIDRLLNICRPSKLLYIALDGVAPRAKMNQQRTRRFIAAKERLAKIEKMNKKLNEANNNANDKPKEGAETTPAEPVYSLPTSPFDFFNFDSNQISPGTEFMDVVGVWLHNYVQERLQSDLLWQNLEVIVSDTSVPGEGEHKLMDFLREQRSQPDYNPNLVHVFYGADADLIMLGTSLHEPNFYILRESAQNVQCFRCMRMGHMAYECNAKKAYIPKNANESSKTVHVGNLPFEINEKELRELFEPYGKIVEVRIITEKQSFKPKGFAFVEFETHEAAAEAMNMNNYKLKGRNLVLSFAKERAFRTEVPSDEKIAQFQGITGLPMEEALQFLVAARWNVEHATAMFFDPNASIEQIQLQREILAISQMEKDPNANVEGALSPFPQKKEKKKRDIKFEYVRIPVFREYMQTQLKQIEEIEKEPPGSSTQDNTNNNSPVTPHPGFSFNFETSLDDFILYCMLAGNDFLPSMEALDIYEGGIDVLLAVYSATLTKFGKAPDASNTVLTKNGKIYFPGLLNYLSILSATEDQIMATKARRMKKKVQRKTSKSKSTHVQKTPSKAPEASPVQVVDEYDESGVEVEETLADVSLNDFTWQQIYYYNKFQLDEKVMGTQQYHDSINKICKDYVTGLAWVLGYYYKGVQSWKWFYPHHYPPLVCDLVAYLQQTPSLESFQITFELGQPFHPLEQLMAIFPPFSGKIGVPPAYYELMINPQSPILDFYSDDFKVQGRGRFESAVLLPFVDENRLLAAVKPLESTLNAQERRRNENHLFSMVYCRSNSQFVAKHQGNREEFSSDYSDKFVFQPSEISKEVVITQYMHPTLQCFGPLSQSQDAIPKLEIRIGLLPNAVPPKTILTEADYEMEVNTTQYDKPLKSLLCLRCNQIGHMARDCPQSQPSCYNCSKLGHFAKDCPMSPQTKKTDPPHPKHPQPSPKPASQKPKQTNNIDTVLKNGIETISAMMGHVDSIVSFLKQQNLLSPVVVKDWGDSPFEKASALLKFIRENQANKLLVGVFLKQLDDNGIFIQSQ